MSLGSSPGTSTVGAHDLLEESGIVECGADRYGYDVRTCGGHSNDGGWR